MARNQNFPPHIRFTALPTIAPLTASLAKLVTTPPGPNTKPLKAALTKAALPIIPDIAPETSALHTEPADAPRVLFVFARALYIFVALPIELIASKVCLNVSSMLMSSCIELSKSSKIIFICTVSYISLSQTSYILSIYFFPSTGKAIIRLSVK